MVSKDREPGPGGPDQAAAAGGAGEGFSFESGLKRLEEIARTLEVRDLPLEKALELFQEGVDLAGRCRQVLDRAERTVSMILEERSGEARLVPLAQEGLAR